MEEDDDDDDYYHLHHHRYHNHRHHHYHLIYSPLKSQLQKPRPLRVDIFVTWRHLSVQMT
jgi:hypothetical protein